MNLTASGAGIASAPAARLGGGSGSTLYRRARPGWMPTRTAGSRRCAMPSYWTCRKCRYRNVRTASRRCQGCGEATKRARRPAAHKRVLTDTAYGDFAVLSVLIHGGAPHACGCCGAPKPEGRKHHREHDHESGEPRGLACFQCNATVLGDRTAGEIRRAAAYQARVDAFYGRGQ